jgi:hypothetical protein
MQVADVNGIRRIIIQTSENRKVGGSTAPWPLYLTCTNGSFLDLFLRAPSQLSVWAILYRSGREWIAVGFWLLSMCGLGTAR